MWYVPGYESVVRRLVRECAGNFDLRFVTATLLVLQCAGEFMEAPFTG